MENYEALINIEKDMLKHLHIDNPEFTQEMIIIETKKHLDMIYYYEQYNNQQDLFNNLY